MCATSNYSSTNNVIDQNDASRQVTTRLQIKFSHFSLP